MEVIRVEHLMKRYESSHNKIKIDKVAVNNISFSVNQGETIAIMGKSGCGKTTLLKLLGGELKATCGEIYYKGDNIFHYKLERISDYRRNSIGFIFQDYRLLENLCVEENILLPALLDHQNYDCVKGRLYQLGEILEIKDHFDQYPYELSGGLKQRVAIARALMNDPEILLADEPTGNLDYDTAQVVMKLLINTQDKLEKTLIVVTHDPNVAAYCNRCIHIESGQIIDG